MLDGFRDWFVEQLAMYAGYHRDRRNQMTHHVGVPLIVFSLLLALTQVPLAQVDNFPLTAARLFLALLLAFYIVAVPLTGVFTAIFCGVMYGVVVKIAEGSAQTVWTVAAAGFAGGWVIQFIGHAFEGRRPALTVNFLQAFMAPTFLVAEMLFVLGFEKDLEAALQQRSVKYFAKETPA